MGENDWRSSEPNRCGVGKGAGSKPVLKKQVMTFNLRIIDINYVSGSHHRRLEICGSVLGCHNNGDCY